MSTAASSTGNCASAAGRLRSTRPQGGGEQEAAEATRTGNQRTEGQRDAIPTVPTTCRLALATKRKTNNKGLRKRCRSEAPLGGTPKNYMQDGGTHENVIEPLFSPRASEPQVL